MVVRKTRLKSASPTRDEDFEDLIEIFGDPNSKDIRSLTMGNVPISGSLCDPEELSKFVTYRPDLKGDRVESVTKLFW